MLINFKNMSIKDKYIVKSIDKRDTYEWLLKVHYAKRIPSIMFSFGIYKEQILEGVCTIGMPPCQNNYGSGIFDNLKTDTFELTRLVLKDNNDKNVLSYFVSSVLKMLKSPSCIISFADPNNNHHGYIYQATNWIYTGLSQKGGKDKQWIWNSREYHAKTITIEWMKKNGFKYDNSLNMTQNWINNGGQIEENKYRKFRYLYLIGNKREKREMKRKLLLPELSYPKGKNERYNTDYQTSTQLKLF